MRAAGGFFVAVFALVAGCDDASQLPAEGAVACASPMHHLTSPGFHGGSARLGWVSQESVLTPAAVGGGSFGLAWSSAQLDGRAYASPVYADDMTMHGAYEGSALSVLFAATTNGWVYAVSAFDSPCQSGTLAAGSILWRSQLVTPAVVPTLDGGVALGTLSTPVLDLEASPPTLYVTAMDSAGGGFTWKAFALDATRGTLLPGWPVVLDRSAMEAANRNGPAYFDDDARNMSQRGALSLSPEGDRLYVTWGGYWDGAVGWIASIDTQAVKIAASFSGAPDTLIDAQGNLSRHANAGMWGPSGPAVDGHGSVYMTTGNSDPSWETAPATWGNSLLRWTKDLTLDATYTPWNFCDLDVGDTDVGASSAVLLPDLGDIAPATPSLVSFGGKEGVAYLLDTSAIGGSLASRPACATSWDAPAKDLSLLPPAPSAAYCDFAPHPQCVPPAASTTCVTGPVVAFGPHGDVSFVDHAKMRTTPAFFRADDGSAYLYLSGTTKSALCSVDDIPPSVVRMRIETNAQGAAYLVRDAADTETRFFNPGSPVVSSLGGAGPVVWVIDANDLRSASIVDPTSPHPILYALDGTTMRVLYRTADADLGPSGKYTTPVVAHGTVFVVTDSVQAFTVP